MYSYKRRRKFVYCFSGKINSKMKIALNMIVYNEAVRLSKSLPMLRKHFDEIVIVDQASCDETVNIARMYADRTVIDKHYGSACYSRPLAHKITESEWMFWLDADENPTERFLTEMRNLVESGLDGFYLNQENLIDGKPDDTNYCFRYRLFKKSSVVFCPHLHGEVLATELAKTKKIEDYLGIIHHKTYTEMEADHHRYISLTRSDCLYIPESIRKAYGFTQQKEKETSHE